MTALETVNKMNELYRAGDIMAADTLFAEKFVIKAIGEPPHNGEYHNYKEYIEKLVVPLVSSFPDLVINDDQRTYVCEDENIVFLGGTTTLKGKKIPYLQMYRVENNQIVYAELYTGPYS